MIKFRKLRELSFLTYISNFRSFSELSHILLVFIYTYISFFKIKCTQYKYCLQKIGHYKAEKCLRAEFHSLVGLLPHDVDEHVLRTGRNHIYVSARLFLDASMHGGYYEQSKNYIINYYGEFMCYYKYFRMKS